MKRLTLNMVKRMGACSSGVNWIEVQLKAGKTAEEMWLNPPSFQWLFWLISHLPLVDTRRTSVKIGVAVARNVTLPDGRKLMELVSHVPELYAVLEAGERYAAGTINQGEWKSLRVSAQGKITDDLTPVSVYQTAHLLNCAGNGNECAAGHAYDALDSLWNENDNFGMDHEQMEQEVYRCIRIAFPTFESLLAETGNRRFTELYPTKSEPLF